MGLGTVGKIDFEETANQVGPAHEKWLNAKIQIIDPDIKGSGFNRMENTKLRTYEVVWEGAARIQAMRWPNVATTRQEAVSIRTVVFHIPRASDAQDDAPLYIPEGWRIRVLDAGRAREFTIGLFVITSSVNSSYDWDRRIETMHDQGASIEWPV